MTKRWMALLLTPALALALVGCGSESSGGGDPAGDSADPGRVGEAPAVREADVDPPAAPEPVVLVGRWEALSQDGTLVHEAELFFIYDADGTGMSLEGRSEKAFTWVHDPDVQTLHILTDNEDMVFQVAMAGETLTLVMSDPPMTLVMRRAPDPGSSDVE